jgi:hypothetical protein
LIDRGCDSLFARRVSLFAREGVATKYANWSLVVALPFRPRGALSENIAYPALKRWAIFFRAVGARSLPLVQQIQQRNAKANG